MCNKVMAQKLLLVALRVAKISSADLFARVDVGCNTIYNFKSGMLLNQSHFYQLRCGRCNCWWGYVLRRRRCLCPYS